MDKINVTIEEILQILKYHWATTESIMKLGCVGRRRAIEIKKEIRKKILDKGKAIATNKIPTAALIEYFGIDINYINQVQKSSKEMEIKND